MAEARPELIYVAGAQKGERSVMMANTVVAGRQAGVDILINDEFASRRHFQLETTYEGWMLTNLSANGTTINGKRYKGDKKIILGTGDVIGIGSKTEMLFVEPGHDPEKALQDYRKSHPEAAPKAQPPKPPPEPAVEQSQAQAGQVQVLPVQPPQAGTAKAQPQSKQSSHRTGVQAAVSPPSADGKQVGPSAPTDKDAAQKSPESQKKSKTRRYIIYGGIYAVMLVLIVIVLIMRPKAEESAGGRPVALKLQDFKKVFEEDLKPDRARNDDAARRVLEKARDRYDNLKGKPENAYLCVYYYREYKAYQAAGKRGLPESNDEQNFAIAKNYLVDQLFKRYENAWTYEERGLWTKAYDGFEDVLRYLPQHDENKDRDVVQILVENIFAHTKYINIRRGRRN
ncbi:MAG: FHA domain-containing protein [Planctomycetes bacterium]|nr:FHA domain-containing protein [Planctomycetota bacterium]